MSTFLDKNNVKCESAREVLNLLLLKKVSLPSVEIGEYSTTYAWKNIENPIYLIIFPHWTKRKIMSFPKQREVDETFFLKHFGEKKIEKVSDESNNASKDHERVAFGLFGKRLSLLKMIVDNV